MKKLPANYPKKYFGNKTNRYNYVQFIRFAVTPTGKIGIDFEQIRIHLDGKGKFATMSNEAIIEYAEQVTNVKRLKKGYSWGELFVDLDFSGRNFVNQ